MTIGDANTIQAFARHLLDANIVLPSIPARDLAHLLDRSKKILGAGMSGEQLLRVWGLS